MLIRPTRAGSAVHNAVRINGAAFSVSCAMEKTLPKEPLYICIEQIEGCHIA